MQKVELFKPEDFDGAECYSNYANKKLQEYLESCPVVYGSTEGPQHEYHWSPHKISLDTHTARLAFIEEIPKELCKQHIPKLQSKKQVSMPLTEDPYGAALLLGCSIVCSKCGVKLQAEWKEVK